MHENIFCQSFQPEPCAVLGTRLDVYSIGHEIALIRDGNPLLTYSESSFAELSDDAKRLALVMAVNVCRRKRRISQLWLGWRAVKSNLPEEIKRFRAYIEAGSGDFPVKPMPRTSGVPFHYFGSPELARLLNYLSTNHGKLIEAHFGGSPLNFPLGLARMLYTANLESEGAIWVKNHQDVDLERKAEESDKNPATRPKVLMGDEAEAAFRDAVAKSQKKQS